MENNNYKSLAQKLMQDGILSSNNMPENIFQNSKDIKQNENIQNPIENPSKNEIKNKKRINQYDLEILQDIQAKDVINFKTVASLNMLQSLIHPKKKGMNKLENLFFKLFPRLYKARLVKDALSELSKLDENAKSLLDKTIPYGEAQLRYEDLIKYLSLTNEIQINLKKKI